MDIAKPLLTYCLLILTLLTATNGIDQHNGTSPGHNNEGHGNQISKATTCSDRYGALPPALFNRRACATCYTFLFRSEGPLVALGPDYTRLGLVEAVNGSRPRVTEIHDPDITNDTSARGICDTLNPDQCARWTECCRAAGSCCHRQLRMPTETGARLCRRTWDGFACWDDTAGGNTLTTQCPLFLAYAIPSRRAVKQCLPNGTWFSMGGYGWTDYKPCLDKQGYLEVMYVGLSCHVLSVLFLVPALGIFASLRELRRQQRIRLHVNFFVSLAAAALAAILWYMLVHHDLLTASSPSQTVLHKNPVWCRVLSFFKLYLQSTNYFWMFCEGYFLHRLISKAFEPPKRLIVLYILGWAVPLLPCIAHAITITTIDNASCWTRSIGGFQWLVYTPNLICLVLNLIFLCNILRILLFQLHAHPHEPSNFRKGLKAAFMLIPLFGLQLFLTMYRPNPNSAYVKEWEFFSTVVNSSQGIFVSVIFCYMNGEVLNNFRKTCPCCRRAQLRRRSRVPSTSVTQYTTYDDDVTRTSVRTRGAAENGTSAHDSREAMEMEDLRRANGTQRKKGGYMAVPTSAATEPAGV